MSQNRPSTMKDTVDAMGKGPLFYSGAYLPVVAKDEEGFYVYSNEANCELMRMPWHLLKGTKTKDHFQEDVVRKMEAMDEAVRKFGPQFSDTLVLGSGAVHPFCLKIPYTMPDGRVLVIGTIFDTFEQFSFLRGWRLFAPVAPNRTSLNLGFWGITAPHKQCCISSDFCQIIGLPLAKAGFGHTIQHYIHPMDLPEFALGLTRLNQGVIRQFTYQIRMKAPESTDWQWVMGLAVAALRSSTYQPIITAGVIWNISSQMKLREEARRRQWLLSSICDHSPLGVMVLDSEFRVTFFNKYMKNIFGVDPSQIQGKTLSQIFHPPQAASMADHAQAVFNAGQNRNEEVELVDLSGRTATLSLTWFPLLDDLGRVSAVGCTSQDVTHIKQVESRVSELEEFLYERRTFGGFCGSSKAMQTVYFQLRHMAKTDATVLILGESGTGKELAAEALHYESPRSNAPLIKVNCAALTESLLESELFGHVRGAFTGAIKDRKGRFAAADGGTLFLDEVGDLSLTSQVKLLRFMDRREYERVGESTTYKADVRIIAATNADLEAKVKAGQFRADFYYRLSALRVTMPPLRERGQDIINIANLIIEKHCKKNNCRIIKLHQNVIRFFLNYAWPGNVRELKNFIDHALLFSDGKEIRIDHLPLEGIMPPLKNLYYNSDEQPHLFQPLSFPEVVSEPYHSARRKDKPKKRLTVPPRAIARHEVEKAIKESGGNKRLAAKNLGIARSSLYRLLSGS